MIFNLNQQNQKLKNFNNFNKNIKRKNNNYLNHNLKALNYPKLLKKVGSPQRKKI